MCGRQSAVSVFGFGIGQFIHSQSTPMRSWVNHCVKCISLNNSNVKSKKRSCIIPLKCSYKPPDLHLKVEKCLQSDESCEVPKLNFSGPVLQIWVGVCTPGNEPHMLPILWQNSSLTHWQISYCILALYTLCDLQFSIKLLLKSKNTDHLFQRTLENTYNQ